MTPAPSPQAFSPGSATLIFLPIKGDSAETTFAQGAAIALSDGVTAAVRSADSNAVFFNGEAIDLPPVERIVQRLAPTNVEVHLETPLPLGCGFGVSAGCALTTAFAIARQYDLDLSREDLARIAHRAEVESGTGIGDVATQITGGIVYRRGESGPFDCVPLPIEVGELFYCVFDPISTKEILADPKFQRTLHEEGQRAMNWLAVHHANLTMNDLMNRSLEFAEQTELLTDARVKRTISKARSLSGSATMVMLGQSVLSTIQTDQEIEWRPCTIDVQGTRWLS